MKIRVSSFASVTGIKYNKLLFCYREYCLSSNSLPFFLPFTINN